MYRSKITATDEEMKRLRSASEPRIAIALHAGPQPKSALEQAHELAISKGLPEQRGFYGIDLETGEFLSQYPIDESDGV